MLLLWPQVSVSVKWGSDSTELVELLGDESDSLCHGS